MNIYSKKSTIEKDNGAPEGRVFSFEVFLSQQKIQMTRYFIAVSVLYSRPTSDMSLIRFCPQFYLFSAFTRNIHTIVLLFLISQANINQE